jgi:hypothetical protein
MLLNVKNLKIILMPMTDHKYNVTFLEFRAIRSSLYLTLLTALFLVYIYIYIYIYCEPNRHM